MCSLQRLPAAHGVLRCGCLFRVLRAMAQARGVPLSKVFKALSVVTRTPDNAVWAMAALAFLLGLPLLYSSSVFSAIASISSLGLYVSCESFEPPQIPASINLQNSRVTQLLLRLTHPPPCCRTEPVQPCGLRQAKVDLHLDRVGWEVSVSASPNTYIVLPGDGGRAACVEQQCSHICNVLRLEQLIGLTDACDCCPADGVPIFLRICKGRGFQQGPFSLGRWYLPVGVMALSWVVVSTVWPYSLSKSETSTVQIAGSSLPPVTAALWQSEQEALEIWLSELHQDLYGAHSLHAGCLHAADSVSH